MENLSIIACVSQDLGLGLDGQLLWHIPADMQFFRQTTTGSTVVMGRKTYDSIGRPLPERTNVVLSRRSIADASVQCCTSQHELDRFLAQQTGPIFIIGGASLYAMYLDRAARLYLTEVDSVKPADTYFPEFDKPKFTRRILQSGSDGDVRYEIAEYTRKL